MFNQWIPVPILQIVRLLLVQMDAFCVCRRISYCLYYQIEQSSSLFYVFAYVNAISEGQLILMSFALYAVSSMNCSKHSYYRLWVGLSTNLITLTPFELIRIDITAWAVRLII